jgi:hypothetical protein
MSFELIFSNIKVLTTTWRSVTAQKMIWGEEGGKDEPEIASSK